MFLFEINEMTDCGKTYLSILTSSCAPGGTGNRKWAIVSNRSVNVLPNFVEYS